MDPRSFASLSSVRAARALLYQRDRETLSEQIEIVKIPAPSGFESRRAEFIGDRLHSLGLRNLRIDEVGNVLGLLPGSGTVSDVESEAPVLVSAHLDTVFPEDVTIRVDQSKGRIRAPGITDNARGLTALLAIADVLVRSGIQTLRPIEFIATVGEEGLGDLRGVKHLFREESPYRSAAAFVSIDGAGLTRIVHRAIGSKRLRVEIRGPGGHSWGDRGIPNPIHAVGLAIGNLVRMTPESGGDYAVNIGRVGGGTSINAIAANGWLEIDLRAEVPDTLKWLSTEAHRVIRSAVASEARLAGSVPADLSIEVVGDRPCGESIDGCRLVHAAEEATRLIGETPELAASSTDANVPIALGIPAIAIGAGGRGGGIHTEDEWFENVDGARGIERALITVLAAAGVHQENQVD